jgi:hypothetical protein
MSEAEALEYIRAASDIELEATETAETEKRRNTTAMIDQTLARINRIHLGLPQSSGDPLEQRL